MATRLALTAVITTGFLLAAAPVAHANPLPEPAPTKAEVAKARVEAARKTYEAIMDRLKKTGGIELPFRDLYRWSQRWLDAALAADTEKAQKVAAAEEHLARMAELEKRARTFVEVGLAAESEADAGHFYRLDAEYVLAKLRSDQKKFPADEGRTALAKARLEAAKRTYEMDFFRFKTLGESIVRRSDIFPASHRHPSWPEELCRWSRRWLDAALAVGTSEAQKVAAGEAYLNRSKEIEKLAKSWVKAGIAHETGAVAAEFYRLDAESLLAALKTAPQQKEAGPGLARARVATARKVFEVILARIKKGAEPFSPDLAEQLFQWSQHWLKAEFDLGADRVTRDKAIQAHRERMRLVEQLAQSYYKNGLGPKSMASAAEFYRLDAAAEFYHLGRGEKP
jgi:hypothetical protein